jgi:hypothetical protein
MLTATVVVVLVARCSNVSCETTNCQPQQAPLFSPQILEPFPDLVFFALHFSFNPRSISFSKPGTILDGITWFCEYIMAGINA